MIIIKKGEEHNYFDKEVIVEMVSLAAKQVYEMLAKVEIIEDYVIGGIGIPNVPTKTGEKKHVWIEYSAKVLKYKVLDMGVDECVIYEGDKIPDYVLDRYNRLKDNIEKIKAGKL